MAVDVGAGFSRHEDAEAYNGEGDEGANGDDFAEEAFGEDTRHQLQRIVRCQQS